MKLTQPDLKVRCTYSHIKCLYEYLMELYNHFDEYVQPLNYDLPARAIYKHYLATICEKIAKLMFKHVHKPRTKFKVTINQGERMVLLVFFSWYDIPTYIQFIQYELKNGLLK